MKKALLALLASTTLLQAAEPVSDLLKQAKPKDSIAYLMVGAAAPFNERAIDSLTPNLSYGMRHFSGLHAKDYCITARVNQYAQSLLGQYSFLFFPFTAKGFAKTHSSFYLGAGLNGGLKYLSKSVAKQNRNLANQQQLELKLAEEKDPTPEKVAQITAEVTKNRSLHRIAPTVDIPLTVGYQFANTNFVQVQLSSLALAQSKAGNGIYATLNYGFGF